MFFFLFENVGNRKIKKKHNCKVRIDRIVMAKNFFLLNLKNLSTWLEASKSKLNKVRLNIIYF